MYLSAMFSIIFFVSPDTKENVDVEPRQLAEATATQAFADADLNADGKLSLEEFNHWYMAVNSDDDDRIAPERPPWLTLKNLKQLTTFKNYSTSVVFDAFAESSNPNGMLDSWGFLACCEKFIVTAGMSKSDYEEVCNVLIGGLFRILETWPGR